MRRFCRAMLQNRGDDEFREEGLRVSVAGPFIIAGDGTARAVVRGIGMGRAGRDQGAGGDVFQDPLREPVVICLFESEGPYRRLAKKWFDQTDAPHFGFYRHADRVMFMNVATGTGTPCTELTHALIARIFRTCHPGSTKDWRVYTSNARCRATQSPGLPNWRLPSLQKAIRDGTLRPLKDLMEDPDFYRRDRVGLNYSGRRYLMTTCSRRNF